MKIHKVYRPDNDATVMTGDCLEKMGSLPKGCCDLVVTSPPYNVGKEYEKTSSLTEYLDGFVPVVREIRRVLTKNGAVCWQVGTYVEAGEVTPLDIPFHAIFKSQGFRLRNRVVWRYAHGLHAKRRFSGRYETILWMTKSDTYTFNLDSVRVPAKYPGKKHFKGPKRGQLSGNPLGKNPSDVWDVVRSGWEDGVWDIPNVKANHPEKTAHPCQYPIEVAERCVLAMTNAGETVFDPFAGAGTTAVAALMHGRKAVCCERSIAYTDIIKDRINALTKNRLPYRPLGKPVFIP